MHRAVAAVVTSCSMLLASCAPTAVVERFDDHKVGAETVTSAGRGRQLVASVRPSASGARVELTSQEVCSQHEEVSLHRLKITKRKTNVAGAVLFYLGAAAGIGTGIGVLADAHNVVASNDSTMKNPVGRTGAFVIGGILSGLGAVALGLGVGTSIRGRDSIDDLGVVREPVDNSARQVQCNEAVASFIPLSIHTGSSSVEVGRTDAHGVLSFGWDLLRSLALTGALDPTGTLTRTDGSTIQAVDLQPARAYWASRMLADAGRLAEQDDVEHARESVERARALGGDPTDVLAKIAAAPTNVRLRAEAEQHAREEAAAKQEEARRHVDAAKALMRRSALAAADAELAKARDLGADVDDLAERLATMMSAKAVAEWKRHIGQCRKVSAAREKIGSISRCDEGCQQIRKQVEKDWARLTTKPTVDGVPDEQLQSIKDQCERAGCPDCP